MRLYLIIYAILFLSLAGLSPSYKIHYCKDTCSPRTRVYKNVDQKLYCYKGIPYKAEKYWRLAVRVAQHFALDPAIFCAQIECESGWNPSIVSRDGGIGLAQVTPRTAGVGKKEWLYDPLYNLVVGAQIKLEAHRRAENLSNCHDPLSVEVLSLRIYNGGWRFLKKELEFLDYLQMDRCSLEDQLRVCARDLCLWKVNVVYVIRVLNGAEKYRRMIWHR